MGLITGLVTLPLAPVRATMWVAELVERQAEQDASSDESAVLAALAELEDARQLGELSGEEAEEAENALLEHLIAIHGLVGPENDGELG
jgi:hypothetical protein